MENIKHDLTDKQIQELARKQKNAYQKQWYDKKKAEGIDKRAEYSNRYWKKKALEELEG